MKVSQSGNVEKDLDAEAQRPFARQLELLLTFVVPLDKAAFDYMLTGSLASRLYGETRSVRNVDVILKITGKQIPKFCFLYPKEEFSCPSQDAVELEFARAEKGRIRLFHLTKGFEADIYPASDTLHQWGLEHRRRIPLSTTSSIWIAPPEYLILRKLQYCLREKNPAESLKEARDLLTIHAGKLDIDLLQAQVQLLGVDAFWKKANSSF